MKVASTEQHVAGLSMVLFFATVMVSLCWTTDATADTEGCKRAGELFALSAATKDKETEKGLLKEAVRLCPGHAFSWNNLGMVLEEDSLWDEAYEAYGRAAKEDPSLSSPYAGLGDVAMKMGRFRDASTHYERFLTLLADEVGRGDPYGLKGFQEEYRMKLEAAREKWEIHEKSMNQVVKREELTRGFSRMTKKEFSKPVGPERLALAVLFAFGSDEINERGRRQLEEVARTMMDGDLTESRFVIEGHTDTLGDEEYNLELSRKRAERVREVLIGRGISPSRLRVSHYGKTRPLVASGGRDEQAMNRRVEFVRFSSTDSADFHRVGTRK